MANKIETTVAAVGGVVLGGLVMYLLDPESGDKRRAAVTDTATNAAQTTHHTIRDAVNSAVESVHNAYDSAADTVKETLHDTVRGARKSADAQRGRASRYAGYAKTLAGKVVGRVGSAATDLSSTLSDHAATVAEHASHLSDRLSELTGHTADAAKGSASDAISAAAGTAASAKSAGTSYADRLRNEIYRNLTNATNAAAKVGDNARSTAKQTLRDAQARADRATGRESHPIATTVGITTGGLALLAAGAGAMYFFDPTRGRSRRAQSADQLFALGRRTGKNARHFGRHVGNRLQGYAAQTRGVVQDWQASNAPDASFAEPSPASPSFPRPTTV